MPRNDRSVFVVHGRNLNARSKIVSILASLNLSALTWEDAVALTRLPAPYTGDVVQTAIRHAAAIIVLMTGDDDASLRKEFWDSRDPEIERTPTPQPRPNVLVEAGLALAMQPRSTIFVQMGRIRPISDLAGVSYVELDESHAAQAALASRLRRAGCAATLPREGKAVDLGKFNSTATLPSVRSQGTGLRSAILRKARAALGLPGFGSDYELVDRGQVGKSVLLAIRDPGDEPLVLRHWAPSSPQPREIGRIAPGSAAHELSIVLEPPPGIHVYDLVPGEPANGTSPLSRVAVEVSE